MTFQTGNIYTVYCYEPNDTVAAVSLTRMDVGSFTYDDAVVLADVKLVRPAAVDPRDGFNHDGWVVIFQLLTGSSAITTSSTIANINSACYTAIKAAYSTQIT